jgi:hypothetical protein
VVSTRRCGRLDPGSIPGAHRCSKLFARLDCIAVDLSALLFLAVLVGWLVIGHLSVVYRTGANPQPTTQRLRADFKLRVRGAVAQRG